MSLRSPLPWEIVGKVWNVWEMICFFNFAFFNTLSEIQSLEAGLRDPLRDPEAVRLDPKWAAGRTRSLLIELKAICAQAELDAPQDRIDRITAFLDGKPTTADIDQSLPALLKVFREALQDQLERREFLFIPTSRASYYSDGETLFKEVLSSFPSVKDDLIAAGQCYALDQPNPCVFYCMGVFQRGLYLLCQRLGVDFPASIELENWKNIIDALEAEIRSQMKTIEQLPKTSQWSYPVSVEGEEFGVKGCELCDLS